MFANNPEDEQWLDSALRKYSATRKTDLRDEILARTKWLAVRSARRFADRGEPYDDIFQVAQLGLFKAVERFDPAQGVHFGAFATPTIVGEIRRYFRDHTWSLKVSRGAKDLRPAVNSAVEDLSKELGRAATVDEIAVKLRVSQDSVIEALEANNAYRTSTIDGPTAPSIPVDGGSDDVIDREVVKALLGQLPERERKILYLRYFDELSQAEIADIVGTSQVHVGRLIASSLASLRSLAEATTP